MVSRAHLPFQCVVSATYPTPHVVLTEAMSTQKIMQSLFAVLILIIVIPTTVAAQAFTPYEGENFIVNPLRVLLGPLQNPR